MNCLHCHATTTNGLALCELCQRHARLVLEYLPVYFVNLARWRPGRAGSRPVPGSRVLYDGDTRSSGDRIQDALDEVVNALTTWARDLEDDRGVTAPHATSEAEQAVALCAWFDRHLVTIAGLEWCGEFARGLGIHERRLQMLTMAAIPGWYAGACRQSRGVDMATGEATVCGVRTYVVPGLTWVTCDGCGTTTYARDHLPAVLEEARVWVAPPMRLAEAIVALVDSEQSVPRLHKRISKWGERGQITAMRRLDADGDEVGPKRYSMGDVLDALRSEGATRTGVRADAVTA